jgi:hypothetical protein
MGAAVRPTLFVLAALALACEGPTGNVAVQLDAEETITDGLDPGTDLESIVDGWTVRFSRYVIAIGGVRLARNDTGAEAIDETRQVVDLMALPATGFVLGELDGLAAGRWNQFGYTIAGASSEAVPALVDPAHYEAMVAGGFSYSIRGTLTNPAGQACPPGGACRDASSIDFELDVPIVTVFHDCVDEAEMAGIAVPENGTATVSATVHGDHIFFDAFPIEIEILERRAQWLANADTDADGTVTGAELMAVDAADLFPSDTYNLANAPIAIRTAWDFVRAQLATQGHVQGEGECVPDVQP